MNITGKLQWSNTITTPVHTGVWWMACLILLLNISCISSTTREGDDNATYTNPIYTKNTNSSITFYGNKYYYVQNAQSRVYLCVGDDPTDMENTERHVICDMHKNYGLTHLWHPQIVNIEGVWYVYLTADDGNTDNHQMYVLENHSKDPLEGQFTMKARISTDKDDNWAIHANVFQHGGEWYMIWSGWETRRVFVETQCLYIARMANPWSLATERVMISAPEYEWELQWVRNDGSSITPYPVFVNEAPFFFCNDKTDKAYIYYSASANWTSYSCFGELSAEKGCDLLDPASWIKNEKPVFRQSRKDNIYGPSVPFIIPSPDGREYYLIYSAFDKENANPDDRHIYMHEIAFDEKGGPNLGQPQPQGKRLAKPSGLNGN